MKLGPLFTSAEAVQSFHRALGCKRQEGGKIRGGRRSKLSNTTVLLKNRMPAGLRSWRQDIGLLFLLPVFPGEGEGGVKLFMDFTALLTLHLLPKRSSEKDDNVAESAHHQPLLLGLSNRDGHQVAMRSPVLASWVCAGVWAETKAQPA